MGTIYCRIRGQDLNLSVPTPVVANTVDYISVNAMFTDEWKSAIKWVFLNQDGTTYRLMMENDNILPDKHLNLNAGKWNIWFMGDITIHGNLTTRITTNVVEFTVLPSGFIDDNILNVPPDVGEQIIAIAQAALEKADDTAEKMAYFEYRANRGDFNGKQGERGLQGEQGEQGIQGIQGVSGVYVGTGEIPEGFNVKINPDGDGTIIIEDAPEDNKEYVRKNGGWVQNSGGGIEEAPEDNKEYVRKNGEWVQNSGGGDDKVDKAQGASHAGEFLVVGSDGEVTTQAFSVLTGGSY